MYNLNFMNGELVFRGIDSIFVASTNETGIDDFLTFLVC